MFKSFFAFCLKFDSFKVKFKKLFVENFHQTKSFDILQQKKVSKFSF